MYEQIKSGEQFAFCIQANKLGFVVQWRGVVRGV
jgi:hypothetical protein